MIDGQNFQFGDFTKRVRGEGGGKMNDERIKDKDKQNRMERCILTRTYFKRGRVSETGRRTMIKITI